MLHSESDERKYMRGVANGAVTQERLIRRSFLAVVPVLFARYIKAVTKARPNKTKFQTKFQG